MHTVKTVMFYSYTAPFTPRTPPNPYYFGKFIFVTVLTLTILKYISFGKWQGGMICGAGETLNRVKFKNDFGFFLLTVSSIVCVYELNSNFVMT